MILHFPRPEILQLALTSGAVPEPMHGAAADFGTDEAGGLWLQPSVSVPATVQTELKRLGVDVGRKSKAALEQHAACWAQTLPLQRGAMRDYVGRRGWIIAVDIKEVLADRTRPCLMLTLACVRAVFLSDPRELVCVGEFAWQPDVQMVSEEVWVQFALSG